MTAVAERGSRGGFRGGRGSFRGGRGSSRGGRGGFRGGRGGFRGGRGGFRGGRGGFRGGREGSRDGRGGFRGGRGGSRGGRGGSRGFRGGSRGFRGGSRGFRGGSRGGRGDSRGFRGGFRGGRGGAKDELQRLREKYQEKMNRKCDHKSLEIATHALSLESFKKMVNVIDQGRCDFHKVAIVSFKNEEDTKAALERLNNVKFDGVNAKVSEKYMDAKVPDSKDTKTLCVKIPPLGIETAKQMLDIIENGTTSFHRAMQVSYDKEDDATQAMERVQNEKFAELTPRVSHAYKSISNMNPTKSLLVSFTGISVENAKKILKLTKKGRPEFERKMTAHFNEPEKTEKAVKRIKNSKQLKGVRVRYQEMYIPLKVKQESEEEEDDEYITNQEKVIRERMDNKMQVKDPTTLFIKFPQPVTLDLFEQIIKISKNGLPTFGRRFALPCRSKDEVIAAKHHLKRVKFATVQPKFRFTKFNTPMLTQEKRDEIRKKWMDKWLKKKEMRRVREEKEAKKQAKQEKKANKE